MHCSGMRCPDRKINALLAVFDSFMSAKFAENIVMDSMSEQILIQICDKNAEFLL